MFLEEVSKNPMCFVDFAFQYMDHVLQHDSDQGNCVHHE